MSLTDRQMKVLGLVASLTQDGVAPTVREIGEQLGISGSSIQHHVDTLTEAGYLSHRPKLPRTIRLTDQGLAVLR